MEGYALCGCYDAITPAVGPQGIRCSGRCFGVVYLPMGVMGIDHYLIDFITVTHMASDKYHTFLWQIQEDIGGTAHTQKSVTCQFTCSVFLGKEANTVEHMLRLPKEKLD